jgi:hypothetical protein
MNNHSESVISQNVDNGRALLHNDISTSSSSSSYSNHHQKLVQSTMQIRKISNNFDSLLDSTKSPIKTDSNSCENKRKYSIPESPSKPIQHIAYPSSSPLSLKSMFASAYHIKYSPTMKIPKLKNSISNHDDDDHSHCPKNDTKEHLNIKYSSDNIKSNYTSKLLPPPPDKKYDLAKKRDLVNVNDSLPEKCMKSSKKHDHDKDHKKLKTDPNYLEYKELKRKRKEKKRLKLLKKLEKQSKSDVEPKRPRSRSPKLNNKIKQEPKSHKIINSKHMNSHLTTAASTTITSNKLCKFSDSLSNEEISLFNSLIQCEMDPNGGALVLSASQSELDNKLRLAEQSHAQLMSKFALYFLEKVYSESEIKNSEDDLHSSPSYSPDSTIESNFNTELNNLVLPKRKSSANYVVGYIRNSAASMPCLLDYFSKNHPQMIVKSSSIFNPKEIITLKMDEYRDNVLASYSNGIYKYGPLLQTSLVGTRKEENGDYFPHFIDNYMEINPFLKYSMPWGKLSKFENMNPRQSDDGPIIWSRPGEQMIPTNKDPIVSFASPEKIKR